MHDHVLYRSQAQLIGYAKAISKKEKENDLGNSAYAVLELLLNASGKTLKKEAWNVQRISIQHFMNEVLRDAKVVQFSETQAFFEFAKINANFVQNPTPRPSGLFEPMKA